jgi:RNA polymerase sigma-70 factor (ECF subfamily)
MTIEASLLGDNIAARAGETFREASEVITPQEFLALYDAYFRRVYNYVRYRCGDTHTADDLTAGIFERAYHRLSDYSPQRGPFSAWLFSIARGIVSHHFRAVHTNPCLSLDEVHEIADENPSPEESLIRSEAQDGLLAALSCLSDRDRDILSLKFGARLTNRRIAEITGLSDNHVGIILYRSLHKLRVFLDQKEFNIG